MLSYSSILTDPESDDGENDRTFKPKKTPPSSDDESEESAGENSDVVAIKKPDSVKTMEPKKKKAKVCETCCMPGTCQ